MELKMSIEELRKRKLFLATPMYGGMCAGIYTKSVGDLIGLLTKYGIQHKEYYLFNESLITRARNYCVDEFLRSDCTHMMFIDADIGFDPNDVITMMAMMSPDGDKDDYDILCGPYPKKCIAWEKIIQAYEKGKGREDPAELQRYVGDYVFNPAPGISSFNIHEPVEVMEGGTGFMMMRRPTFKAYDEKYPEQSYKPDHVRTEHFSGDREIMAYFDCIIDPKSKRYLSEDYMFCQNIRNAGKKVWLCPWMKMVHVGTYMFGGSLADLASIQAHATANHKAPIAKTMGATPKVKAGDKTVVESKGSATNSSGNRQQRRAAQSRKKKGK